MHSEHGEEPDSIVEEILTDTILRGERAFGWIRIAGAGLALIQIWFLFGLSWLNNARIDVLSGVLGITLLCSWWLLRRLRTEGPSRRLLATSLAIDRFGILGSLCCLIIWPAAAYPGIGRVPELGFLFIVTVAAGLRLTSRLALSAALVDALALAALLQIDRVMNPEQITTTVANEMMVMLVMTMCGALAWTISNRSARLVSRGASEARGAERTRQRLGAYVSTELLEHVLGDGSDMLAGRRQTVVVLFSDLRGFTQYSESREPEGLVDELNHYFEAMLEPIQAHGGVVDKFMGDAIMAVWGVPEGRPDDSIQALRAAQGMNTALAEHNQRRAERNLPPLRHGIGLHLGEVVAGDIGTTTRRQYTVVGDPVNIASRLESMTKELGTPLIVSKSVVDTAQHSGGQIPDVEHRGTVTVRGRKEPVEIFSLR
jgi:class 3 adenylate cyclase